MVPAKSDYACAFLTYPSEHMAAFVVDALNGARDNWVTSGALKAHHHQIKINMDGLGGQGGACVSVCVGLSLESYINMRFIGERMYVLS